MHFIEVEKNFGPESRQNWLGLKIRIPRVLAVYIDAWLYWAKLDNLNEERMPIEIARDKLKQEREKV